MRRVGGNRGAAEAVGRGARRATRALIAFALVPSLMGRATRAAASVDPAVPPAPARGPAPPADTTLDHFFGALSDSTDRYFGGSAAPLDTAGLDSARAAGIAQGPGHGPRRPLRLHSGPTLRFDRAEGGVYGADFKLGRRSFGRGHVEYLSGPRRAQGDGVWERHVREAERGWDLEAGGGRETAVMDRVRRESIDHPFASIQSLASGGDRRMFFRREGYRLAVTRVTPAWRARVGWRDEVESPLAVTTRWNLSEHPPQTTDNLAAARGRAREALLALSFSTPRLPIQAEIEYRTARRTLGSDFEYRSTRLAVGAEIGFGRWSSLAPQALVGRLTGDTPPQQAFYLDRAGVLSTRDDDRLGGTRIALARLDWIGTRDLLALAHLPHPAMFPLQGIAFAASGAVWGADPYGGPPRTGDYWPEPGSFSSEAGVALAWQPGIPDPTSLASIGVAWPIDGRPARARLTLSFRRALFLLQPLGR